MLVGVVMAAEKNFPHGQRLRIPLGAGLLVLALAIASIGVARLPSSVEHHHGREHGAADASAMQR